MNAYSMLCLLIYISLFHCSTIIKFTVIYENNLILNIPSWCDMLDIATIFTSQIFRIKFRLLKLFIFHFEYITKIWQKCNNDKLQ